MVSAAKMPSLWVLQPKGSHLVPDSTVDYMGEPGILGGVYTGACFINSLN